MIFIVDLHNYYIESQIDLICVLNYVELFLDNFVMCLNFF